MLYSSLSKLLRFTVLCILLPIVPVHAQLRLWGDQFNGGVVSGAFSLGAQGGGFGVIDLPLPAGASVRKAELYVFSIGVVAPPPHSFELGTHPITLDASTYINGYSSPVYGQVEMHRVDLTTVLDPSVDQYAINLLGRNDPFNEYHLLVQYTLPGAGPIVAELFFCDKNSTYIEDYTIRSLYAMDSAQPIAFGTMGNYAGPEAYDCEHVEINGTDIGRYFGGDYNTLPENIFGCSATFHYANGTFEGIGDDVPDQAINGGDVLTDLVGLLTDPYTFEVSYRHCPINNSQSRLDNNVNLMLLAYTADPCSGQLDLGPDTLLCYGDSLVINIAGPAYEYRWNDGHTGPERTIRTAGTYIVQASLAGCNTLTDTLEVGFLPDITFSLGPDRTSCTGTSVTLGTQPVPGAHYVWSDGFPDPSRSVQSDGSFHLVASLAQCSARDSVTIHFIPCLEDSFAVVIPNVFSPNGDGVNDRLSAIALSGVDNVEFSVYNRWGQLLHRSSGPTLRWDGRTTSGAAVPDGVYFWTVTYTRKGTPAEQHGSITLLR